MLSSAQNRQYGFTLVEVMMATTILLAGFIGFIQAITIGSGFLDTARKRQVANQIVAAEIEKLRGGAWSTLANLPASGSISINLAGAITGDAASFGLSNRTVDKGDDNTELCALARGFTCSFTRTHLRPSGASATTVSYIKLAYTVRWTGNTGSAQSHRIHAFFGKNGLHLSFQQS
jgi:prepilin-type N-terminal cleavage/methylation domain-containing protein